MTLWNKNTFQSKGHEMNVINLLKAFQLHFEIFYLSQAVDILQCCLWSIHLKVDFEWVLRRNNTPSIVEEAISGADSIFECDLEMLEVYWIY